YRIEQEVLYRIKADKMGIVFVGNGVYHASMTENGKKSPLLEKENVSLYALIEDYETRGITSDKIDSKVKSINYDDLVDIIFNDYDKVVWM
ncbi:MAG: hypothetical protein N2738_03750, partial [Thermodesulfovibrionales bacterium]|nr:hypothetical protein [Thermodesulfovibrionales bacterium]